MVDRPGWVRVNADGMARLLTPLVARLEERRPHPPGRIGQAIGPRATGLQAGAVLAFLSGKVLGQFEFFADPDGQLLLVAPNVVEAERTLGVDPADFRLWVCLHEVTHRLQFTAVPWLRDHLTGEIDALVAATDLDPDALRERLAAVTQQLGRVVRGERDDAGQGLLGLVQSPAQREVVDRLTAFMSLVEGHAEYVMNAVGPDVVGSITVIRERFGRRRQGTGPLDRFLRRRWVSTSSSGSTRTAAGSSARWSTRSAWRASTRSGRPRRRCPAASSWARRWTGWSGCTVPPRQPPP